ncbi:unnamed protein product [Umbelopsis ramanniana]
MFGGHHHRRHHSAPSTPFLGSGGRITPRELAVDTATFAGAEALIHQYENRHHEQHHPLRDAAFAGAAAFGAQKIQNYFDQPQMTGYPMQQYQQYQQPYGGTPYNYYGGGYGANPYGGGYGGGYGGYGSGYNVYNGYNTYNMYGGDMYQNPYMPYQQQHYHRRHLGGGLFSSNPYEREFQPRYSIMQPGQNWGMQQPFY